MAEYTQVGVELAQIESKIVASRGNTKSLLQQLQDESARLAGIPGAHADVIATIQAYTPTGAANETAGTNAVATLKERP